MVSNAYDHNCFSKWMLDWLTPRVIGSGTETITLGSSGTSEDCLAIWPGMDGDDLFSEIFFVQNRQPVGNDSHLAKGGLMIWHVDARLDSSGNNFVFDNSFSAHKLVRLMEADGNEDIEANRGFDTGDLYTAGKSSGPTTKPSSVGYDAIGSGVEVRVLSVSGDRITITVSISRLLSFREVTSTYLHKVPPLPIRADIYAGANPQQRTLKERLREIIAAGSWGRRSTER